MLTTMLLLLFAAKAPLLEPDRDDVKKLQGKWIVTDIEHGGKKTPVKELAKLLFEAAGAKMTTHEGGELKEEVTLLALDTKAKPWTMDMKVASGSDAGKLVKAIYKQDGDTMTICFAEPGQDRPKEFAGKLGTGHTLMVLKKANKK